MKEALSKETTIIAHKAMWTWIADTIKKEQWLPKKAQFKHPNFPDIKLCRNRCYLCEYAKQQRVKASYENSKKTLKTCAYCPATWSNETNCCVLSDKTGLMDQYLKAWYEADFDKAEKLARQIANVPERNEV